MSWTVKTALELGRVSNLPTVWSNTLAGVVLAGASPFNWNIFTVLIAMSMAYVGGMFLNDAFDRKIDAKERPERPIPSGRIKAPEVFAAGTTLLAGAVFFSLLAAMGWGGQIFATSILSVALVICIVIYNRWHKDNPYSPVTMGCCRALVIICAGFCASTSPFVFLYIAAVLSLAYIVGLTYVAKQENIGQVKNQWPLLLLGAPILFGLWASTNDTQVLLPTVLLAIWCIYCVYLIKRRNSGVIPRAVVSMIAGIALADAIFIASVSSLTIAAIACLAFGVTLMLQRVIAGT